MTALPSYFSRCCFGAALVAAISAALPAYAELKLPALISDHMVLQANEEVPIWGWGTPGEKVNVSLGESAPVMTTVEPDGRWKVALPKQPAGGPFTLSVRGSRELTVNDVLVGEVWLGSGQSNMAMTVNRANDFEQESAAATFPQIRMFTVTSGPADQPQSDCQGSWVVCSPATVSRFSATAYFFGRELHRELKVPIGLINSSVGGTAIESWIAEDAQAATPELRPLVAAAAKADAAFDEAAAKAKFERDLAAWQERAKAAKRAGKAAPRRPQDPVALRSRKGGLGGLYNGKIAPLTPYRIRGMIWYQGEANSTPEKAAYYQHQLPLLVRDWRARWGYEFPAAWVQLPNFRGAGRDWPAVREAMLRSLDKIPHSGMAITIDIGDPDDIHPKNKQDVGQRLAMWALGSVYGQPVATSGPIPEKWERRGSTLVVKFRHADDGLQAKGDALTGFELADGGDFKPATARIDGAELVLSNDTITKPTAARYAWENNPTASLFNAAGLPATPFQVSVEDSRR